MSDDEPGTNGDGRAGPGDAAADYDALLLLERLESLEEDMEELGITSRDQLRQRIAELHRRLDEED